MGIKKENVEISRVSLSQAREFADFHNSYYGTKRKGEHWIWQYKTYAPDKAVFATIRDNGTLIGTQAMMPVYMRIGGKRILTGKSENTLLLPAYRGKNLMEELYEYAIKLCKEKGFEFIWGFTPAIKAFRKFGFSSMPIANFFFKPGLNLKDGLTSKLNQTTSFSKKIATSGKYLYDFLKYSKQLTLPKIKIQNDYEVSTKDINLSEIRLLQNQLDIDSKPIITPSLDKEYVDWRIRNHPFLQHQEYTVYRKGMLYSYAFIMLYDTEISISDFCSLDEYSTSIMLSQIIQNNTPQASRFNILLNPNCAVYNRSLMRIFDQLGFKHRGSTLNLVIRDLSNKKFENSRAEQWNVTGIWTEGHFM